MTIDEFITKYLHQKLDWDGYYAGQCVDLFRYYCDEVLNIPQPAGVWGAANFWSDFDTDPILVKYFTKIENTQEFIPQKGDIAIWNFKAGGGYGHVSVVDRNENTTSYFYSFDQNWSKISYCEIVKHTYTNIFGFLRPKKAPMATISIETSVFEKLVAASTKMDEVVALGYTSAAQVKETITKLEADLQAKQNAIEENTQDLKELLAELEEAQKQISKQDIQLRTCEVGKEGLVTELNSRGIRISELEKEIKDLNLKLESIPETPEMSPTWTNLFSMFRLVLKGWLN